MRRKTVCHCVIPTSAISLVLSILIKIVPDRKTVVEPADCLGKCRTGTLHYPYTYTFTGCLLVFPVTDPAVIMLESDQLLFPLSHTLGVSLYCLKKA